MIARPLPGIDQSDVNAEDVQHFWSHIRQYAEDYDFSPVQMKILLDMAVIGVELHLHNEGEKHED